MVKLGDRIQILVEKYCGMVIEMHSEAAKGGDGKAQQICEEAAAARALLPLDIGGSLEATLQCFSRSKCKCPALTDFTAL